MLSSMLPTSSTLGPFANQGALPPWLLRTQAARDKLDPGVAAQGGLDGTTLLFLGKGSKLRLAVAQAGPCWLCHGPACCANQWICC